MKLLSIVSLLAVIFLAAGCADPMEERTTDEVGAQLQRGIRGQGTIGPIQRAEDDPAGEHGVPTNHP
ncbi:MAG: hypothetical protein ACJ8M1_03790 [Chthoniobacterales bacterium]